MLSTLVSTENRRQAMGRKSSKVFVGMDVHKESIDLATAEEGGEVRHQWQIDGDMKALWRVVRKRG
jgi:transposase